MHLGYSGRRWWAGMLLPSPVHTSVDAKERTAPPTAQLRSSLVAADPTCKGRRQSLGMRAGVETSLWLYKERFLLADQEGAFMTSPSVPSMLLTAVGEPRNFVGTAGCLWG
eukprot:353522-Chlamydomonas_euryale.AAC.1